MTQPDGTGADQAPPDGTGQPAASGLAGPAVAVGVVALAAGLPDPWLPARLRHLSAILRGERRIHSSYAQAVGSWLNTVRPRVVSPHGNIDSHALLQSEPHLARALTENVVQVDVREVYAQAFEAAAGWEPDANERVRDYLASVTNRMSHVPEQTFHSVRMATMKATSEGMSMDDLAGEIQKILTEADVPTWSNRALVVARTETIGAYNAGTLAGWQSYAAQLGGDWEKAWLCTHDDRTRPTHLAADVGAAGTGQRVPLGEPFAVGDALLDHPGALGPAATPEEVIQCRCSMVLLRPGEDVDLSNRHLRRLP